MVVVDAVNLVVDVHCKRDAVQTFVTDAAPEAAGMIGLAHCLQDLERDNAK